MKDITRFIILGCGHVGTTLVSGIFKVSGFGTIGLPTNNLESPVLNPLNKRIIGEGQMIESNIKGFLDKLENKTNGKWALKDSSSCSTISKIYSEIWKPIKIICNYRNLRSTVRRKTKRLRN